jgi:hypothetical protein
VLLADARHARRMSAQSLSLITTPAVITIMTIKIQLASGTILDFIAKITTKGWVIKPYDIASFYSFFIMPLWKLSIGMIMKPLA